jgi:cytochrome bd-type quinol oxidase subunit 2
MPCEEYLHLVSLKAGIYCGFCTVLVLAAIGAFAFAFRRLKANPSPSASAREGLEITAVVAFVLAILFGLLATSFLATAVTPRLEEKAMFYCPTSMIISVPK